jgi:N-acetylmuramoyl-L-alanine amidase
MRISNRKRFNIFILFSLVVVLLSGIAFITKNSFTERNARKDIPITSMVIERSTPSSSDTGNIYFEENEYFKKYTIKFSLEQNEVKFNEDDGFINIAFNKNMELKLNSNSFLGNSSREVFYEESGETNILNIKKQYVDDNFVYVDNSDKKNVIVLVSKKDNPYKYKVVLDPGHGGIDKGVNIDDIYEKDIVLKIVKFMINDLRYSGCQVLPTRETDKLLALSEVADFTNNNYADVFLSVHINSFQESKYQGIGTYYYDDEGFQKEERIRLAKTVQKHSFKSDDWKDRGIFRDKLKVLRLTRVPGVLVECGFLTNPEDKERLLNDKVLLNLAKNLSEGILEYLNNK